jgi:hypothetical protein
LWVDRSPRHDRRAEISFEREQFANEGLLAALKRRPSNEQREREYYPRNPIATFRRLV